MGLNEVNDDIYSIVPFWATSSLMNSLTSSAASILIFGGNPPPPHVPIKRFTLYVTYMRERAKRESASETLYFQVSKYLLHLHINTINAVLFYNYLWYGAINDSIAKNTNIENIYVYASEWSERA